MKITRFTRVKLDLLFLGHPSKTSMAFKRVSSCHEKEPTPDMQKCSQHYSIGQFSKIPSLKEFPVAQGEIKVIEPETRDVPWCQSWSTHSAFTALDLGGLTQPPAPPRAPLWFLHSAEPTQTFVHERISSCFFLCV